MRRCWTESRRSAHRRCVGSDRCDGAAAALPPQEAPLSCDYEKYKRKAARAAARDGRYNFVIFSHFSPYTALLARCRARPALRTPSSLDTLAIHHSHSHVHKRNRSLPLPRVGTSFELTQPSRLNAPLRCAHGPRWPPRTAACACGVRGVREGSKRDIMWAEGPCTLQVGAARPFLAPFSCSRRSRRTQRLLKTRTSLARFLRRSAAQWFSVSHPPRRRRPLRDAASVRRRRSAPLARRARTGWAVCASPMAVLQLYRGRLL